MSGAGASTGYRVRLGELSDTEALVPLINLAFLPERVAIEGDRVDAEGLQTYFAKGKFLLLEGSEGLAGCVYAELRAGKRGYIGLLAVQPELQGRGLGRLLMSCAEEYLASTGCEWADLRTISARNDLVPLYQHLGYEQTGTAEMPGNVPLKMPCHFIMMSKRLTPLLGGPR